MQCALHMYSPTDVNQDTTVSGNPNVQEAGLQRSTASKISRQVGFFLQFQD